MGNTVPHLHLAEARPLAALKCGGLRWAYGFWSGCLWDQRSRLSQLALARLHRLELFRAHGVARLSLCSCFHRSYARTAAAQQLTETQSLTPTQEMRPKTSHHDKYGALLADGRWISSGCRLCNTVMLLGNLTMQGSRLESWVPDAECAS